MQPYQQRVVDEKTELDKKATALSNFIGHSAAFETLDPAEQERLKVQNDIMWQYSEILGARITAFGGGTVSCDEGDISDGHHTFNELYEHRHLLFIALLATAQGARAWWSRLHADGTMYPGWVIAGIKLPTGMITYHIPDRYITILTLNDIKERQKAPEWDGHTPTDVLKRLSDWLHL